MRSHRPPGRPPGGPRGRGSGPRTRSDSDMVAPGRDPRPCTLYSTAQHPGLPRTTTGYLGSRASGTDTQRRRQPAGGNWVGTAIGMPHAIPDPGVDFSQAQRSTGHQRDAATGSRYMQHEQPAHSVTYHPSTPPRPVVRQRLSFAGPHSSCTYSQ